MLVFDRSGVGGDFNVLMGMVVGVVGVIGTPTGLRTIVNLVGLNECCWDTIGDWSVVCFTNGPGAKGVGGFGITDTTGFDDDFRVTNFCVDPDGFN